MAKLFGREYTRDELLRRVGDISQIARVKPYRLVEGHEDGVLAVDVITGGGLEFTVLGSRGLDISSARHNGRPLAWRSPTSDQHPAFYEPQGTGWLRTFYGGMLLTCGLTWMGAPGEDEGRELGLHGRISHAPATNVHWDGYWEGDEYVLSVSGKVREAVVFGENVQLTRRIWTRLGENALHVEDEVENLGYERVPHMLLYHINVGWPAVDEGAKLIARSRSVTPRDPEAERALAEHAHFTAPAAGFREQVYFHDLEPDAEGYATAMVSNTELEGSLAVYVRYRQAELPYFTEWKMLGEGTFVVGLEPGNALVIGRAAERAAGRLQYLEPGERRSYRLELGVVHADE